MPTYVALTYTRDVDWTQPEFGQEMKEYAEFGKAAAAVIRGGNAEAAPGATADPAAGAVAARQPSPGRGR